MEWYPGVVGVREHVPVLVASAPVWRTWRGLEEPESSFEELQGEVRVVPVGKDARPFVPLGYEGGAFEVGVDVDELVVLQQFGAGDDDDVRAANKAFRDALGGRGTEFLAGEIEIDGGVIIGDSWASGAKLAELGTSPKPLAELVFFVPLAAGRYFVLEGSDDESSAAWCRLRPAKTSGKRPRKRPAVRARTTAEHVADIESGISLATPIGEARALESARQLVTLGRPDLALAICDRASEERAALAQLTRVFALAAMRSPGAVGTVTSLAEDWLGPATSVTHASQVLPRADLLQAIDAVRVIDGASHEVALDALRARIAGAPEPAVFVSDGEGGDWF